MNKKFAFLASSVLALSLTLTACGSSDNQAGETAATKNLLDQVKSAGTLKIGTEGTYAPFTYHDKDGKLTGFDIEVANEVAKRLGVKAEYVETQWDGMFAGLDAKRFDMIANEVGIRPDRQEKYDFSDPYIVSKAVLIVNKDNTTIKTFADLKGKKAAQSLTSNLTDIAKQNGAEIVGVEGFNPAIDMLVSKRVDATVNDGLSYLDLVKQKPDLPLKKVDEQADGAKNGLMFRKNNKEMVDAVNKALTDIKSDGTYLKISEKYFGADVSK
ncbi:amino acid ABC transporter substrate-binding protein [Tumebacillus permanentifrigoris]|uniref:Amino acid ABC transporter substrate-binding protein (PAAT family) n=1 Tax=Tumebacillus permanentifrigoris TaxID=378543 RepID=A0A316D9A3_9BACL|nr:amino acid ABC transporter substrate-binding protein [Tumebacillus permanentifrigoris]PWK13340.1 amino acid ABC transporter substrate-binding protein (PAAT family) [Tumebacillus permanentifrigoris]